MMIKFACPGCSTVFTIGDEKAGKKGKCPKCSAQFEIPGIEPAVQAPATPTVSDDEFEIEPCPGCHSKLTVDSRHLGLDVECPYCKTVYTALKVGSPTFNFKKEEAPVQVDRKFEEDIRHADEDGDDRPLRKRRRFEDDEDEDEDDEYDDDENRPRPRRRWKRRRSSRNIQSASVTAVGIISLILGGLSILCSCLMFGIAKFAKEINEQEQVVETPEEMRIFQFLYIVVGVSYVIFSVTSLIAGYGVLKRLKFGRWITFVSATFALLGCLASLVCALGNMLAKNPAGVFTGIISAIIYGGYGVFALFTMMRHGDEFE